MNILLENYKGFDIFFDKEESNIFFIHDKIGRVDGFRTSVIKEKIDELVESTFIKKVRAYMIDGDDYIDVHGFYGKKNFIIEYKDGFKSSIVSSVADKYFLEESKNIVEKIRSAEKEILDLREKIKEYRSQIKTISSLIK